MLCEAYKRGLTWPKYVWIFHSYQLDDLLRLNSTSNEECSVQKILEGIFVFQLTQQRSNFNSENAHHYCNKCNTVSYNPYADLLHDSVCALISNSLTDNTLFSQICSRVSVHDSSTVYIYHYMNDTTNLAGIYNGTSHSLKNVSETMLSFTDYDLPLVHTEAMLTLHLLPLSFLSFIFNTVLLVLYTAFHNEPSVKSTSVALSILIFTGCYLLVGFSVVVTLNRQYRLDLCMVIVWLSGIGLSVPLILATVLVKMLRVYRILTALRILKWNIVSSNYVLIAYTMLIISPNIIILTLWTVSDPYRKVINFIEHPGFIKIEVNCHTDKVHIWFALGIIYFFMLSLAVVIVAIKSRKIRLFHFKDTKKVNLFICLVLLICIGGHFYWNILLIIGFYDAYLVVIIVEHTLPAFLCHILLFAPKIWPTIQTKNFH